MVAPTIVPPERVKVLFTWIVLEMVSEPPEVTNACWLWILLTMCAPEEWVTVMLGPEPITTSSLVSGNWPVLQLTVVFQSPLPPVHVIVAPRAEVAHRGRVMNTTATTEKVFGFI